jgi:TrmH family RNA methyltransferase
VATSSHAGDALTRAALPWPCAWVLGHEGQGVAAALLARCALQVRIPQPGGEESLNVAAAAAVCLYESVRRRLGGVQ